MILLLYMPPNVTGTCTVIITTTTTPTPTTTSNSNDADENDYDLVIPKLVPVLFILILPL